MKTGEHRRSRQYAKSSIGMEVRGGAKLTRNDERISSLATTQAITPKTPKVLGLNFTTEGFLHVTK